VKLAIKIAAVAGGVFTALAVSGCGAHAAGDAGAAGGPFQAGARGCTAYSVYAIEHHITVTGRPAPCRGLSRAEVNQAVVAAVLRVTGDAPKALRRKRAAEAAAYVYHLVTALPPAAASALPAVSGSPAPRRTRDLPMSLAALIAWLLTAGSGGYVLGSWIAHGGSLRRLPGTGGDTGASPSVIFGHFGLALGGLLLWAAYLVTGWAALAWTSVALLLPVAGLGMATLAAGLPRRRRPAASVRGGPAEAAGLDAGATVASSGAFSVRQDDGATSGSARVAGIGAAVVSRDSAGAGSEGQEHAGAGGVTGGRTGTGVSGRASVRARLSPLVVAGHGVLAVTTMLLVLLAALGTAAG
jgi:manganese efflux pump family protein